MTPDQLVAFYERKIPQLRERAENYLKLARLTDRALWAAEHKLAEARADYARTLQGDYPRDLRDIEEAGKP